MAIKTTNLFLKFQKYLQYYDRLIFLINNSNFFLADRGWKPLPPDDQIADVYVGAASSRDRSSQSIFFCKLTFFTLKTFTHEIKEAHRLRYGRGDC